MHTPVICVLKLVIGAHNCDELKAHQSIQRRKMLMRHPAPAHETPTIVMFVRLLHAKHSYFGLEVGYRKLFGRNGYFS